MSQVLLVLQWEQHRAVWALPAAGHRGGGCELLEVQLRLHGAVHGSALQNSERMPFIFAVRTNVWIASWPS